MGLRSSKAASAAVKTPSTKANIINLSPLTFQVAPHQANPVKLYANEEDEDDNKETSQKNKKKKKLIVSSAQSESNPRRVACFHGFIRAVTEAYNQHYRLIIRPDDVWLAILTQFSTYVNQNAEALRSKFVDFEGKKQLFVDGGGTLFTAAYDVLALSMSTEIAKNIRDPSIREWVLPSFTTTTPSDVVVGSVALMAAMQQFFSYKFCLSCGIPAVTLLGEVADWQDIERRAARLAEFDINGQMTKWSKMLAPVLAQFTKSAQGAPEVEFWQKVCHYSGGGSGPTYLSGWITMFCVFNDRGQWMGDAQTFDNWGHVEKTEYLFINSSDLPAGVLKVPVTVDDNGTAYQTTMVAGHSALTIVEETGVQPTLEWSLYLDDEQ